MAQIIKEQEIIQGASLVLIWYNINNTYSLLIINNKNKIIADSRIFMEDGLNKLTPFNIMTHSNLKRYALKDWDLCIKKAKGYLIKRLAQEV